MRRALEKWRVVLAALAVVLLCGLAAGCSRPGGVSTPRVKAGVLDLRTWDFTSTGVVELAGEWDVYWGQLLDGTESPNARARPPDAHFRVPGSWYGQRLDDGRVLGSFGYATYHAVLFLPERAGLADDPWAIYPRTIGTSYKLVVRDGEGRELAHPIEAGVVGTSRETSVPSYYRQQRTLAPTGSREVHVYLQVSNYLDLSGGPWWSPLFGRERALAVETATRTQNDVAIGGLIFVMGLYHLALYALRRKEKPPLWFGLFAIAVAVRTLVIGRYLEDRYPDLGGFILRVKVEYIDVYVAVALFVVFLSSLFPVETPRWFLRIVVGFASACTLVTLVSPLHIAGQTLKPFQYFTLCVVVGILVIVGRALVRQRDSVIPKLIAAGTLAVAAATINDVLRATEVIHTAYVTHYGLFTFIFFQSLVIAVLNQQARSRAEDLAAELDSKNAALSRMDQLKDEFLANTSHELRTPLNGIIGLAESLLDGAAGMLGDRVRQNLAMIATSGKRLASLVNDILDFSKLRHKNIELARRGVDVRAMVDNVLALARPLVGRKRVVLVNALPAHTPTVLADENRFQQILLNLVGNAIKFTETGCVEVSTAERGEELAITVSDTGIGIHEEKLARVFESFEQADGSTAREYGGTGLGLAITRQLVELHGGSITAGSVPGQGSRFTFTLPIFDGPAVISDNVAVVAAVREPESEALPAATRPSSAALRRRFRILAVDDDAVNLAVLQNQLAGDEYHVTTAQSGADALAHVASEVRFDAVLLDVMMPRMTGYEVCRRIRETFPANELPVVLLTAKNQVADLVTGFDAGANDYLTKPFSKKELISRIHTHISLAKKNIAYGRFVPKEFLQLLGKDDVVDVDLGDQVQKDMTLLFCDIRSFTSRSEKLSPAETFGFLNACLSRIGPVVREHGGFVDKFIGDAIMALFPGDPEDAVRAAIGIQREVQALDAQERAAGGDGIAVGVGIHTGSTMLGTIGEAERMEGTVISDAVNLASRIEGVTKAFGVSVLVSEGTLAQIGDPSPYRPRFLGLVQLRGKKKPVAVFEIVDGDVSELRSRKIESDATFQEALRLYQQKDLERAAALFTTILAASPNDGPARFYLAQCRRHLEHGAPNGWDGVVTFDVK